MEELGWGWDEGGGWGDGDGDCGVGVSAGGGGGGWGVVGGVGVAGWEGGVVEGGEGGGEFEALGYHCRGLLKRWNRGGVGGVRGEVGVVVFFSWGRALNAALRRAV